MTDDETLSLHEPVPDGGMSTYPALFLVLEAGRPQASSSKYLLRGVDEVRIGRGTTRSVSREGRTLRIQIPDPALSSSHARLRIGPGSVVIEDCGSKNGTRVDGERVRSKSLGDRMLLELGSTFLIFRSAVKAAQTEPNDVSGSELSALAGMRSLEPNLAHDFQRYELIARSAQTVLITGATGVGKELVARSLHDLSERPGPFVAINCGAIPDALVHSELFGHRRGAFSGADAARQGLITASDGGTLFLDEVGELSPMAQKALLRALQEREVLPLGSNTPVPVDLRIIAATLRDLDGDTSERPLREDLYARLAGFVLKLPALGDRMEDFGLIVADLLARQSKPIEAIEREAARALLRYPWPRNIRELEQCLASAAVLSAGKSVTLADLPNEVARSEAQPPVNDGASSPALSDEDAALRAQLVALLGDHRGNVTRVAAELGKKRQQVQKWCRRLEIDPDQFRAS